MHRSVYVAYTGGTIGMTRTPGGYAPAPGLLEARMREMPELRSEQVPRLTVHEHATLLDSANMTPADWNAIAEDIAANYAHHDGFVVLHGTDTMAYTAAALSFMLEGLAKPVVVTGSQIPIGELRNDARGNLIASLLVAGGADDLPEVCLCFGAKLLRGNRAVKVSATGLDAFDSPNYPPLGDIGIGIEIHRDSVRRRAAGEPFRLQRCSPGAVAALRLFPGISAEVVANALRPPLLGLVLECYGVGNAPDRDRRLLAALAEASGRGVVIVDVTQCLRGRVDLGGYAAGSALAEVGVIGGHDMTAEAALTKLLYLFGRGLPPEEVKREMQRDLRGELTPPASDADRRLA